MYRSEQQVPGLCTSSNAANYLRCHEPALVTAKPQKRARLEDARAAASPKNMELQAKGPMESRHTICADWGVEPWPVSTGSFRKVGGVHASSCTSRRPFITRRTVLQQAIPDLVRHEANPLRIRCTTILRFQLGQGPLYTACGWGQYARNTLGPFLNSTLLAVELRGSGCRGCAPKKRIRRSLYSPPPADIEPHLTHFLKNSRLYRPPYRVPR